MLIYSVFIISLSSLIFEVLLTRVFSISQWNHLSFMVISIALFGFGASGTFLSILETNIREGVHRLKSGSTIKLLVSMYAISSIGAFLTLNHIPLDYFRLAFEFVQGLYLLLSYLILSVPFFIAGTIISLAYASMPEKTALVYLASMGGSALGAVIPFPLTPVLGEENMIILSSMIAATPLIWNDTPRHHSSPVPGGRSPHRFRGTGPFITITVLGIILIHPRLNALTHISPSPYKALNQTLRLPDTRIKQTSSSLKGRIDRVDSPHFRFAPGLSLKFPGSLPVQQAVFTDGDEPFTLYHLKKASDLDFARYTLSYMGYRLHKSPPRRTLVIEEGGGIGIACAKASGCPDITVVHSNAQLAHRIGRHYTIPVVPENPRAFSARTRTRYDVIHVENWGASLPGTAALNQDHLLTIDAFAGYFNRLSCTGVILVSRILLLPPSDSIRLWANAYEALKQSGIRSPENHMIVFRDWQTYVLIITSYPLTSTDIIEKTAHRLNFDIVYMPGIHADRVNRFNIFKSPHHFSALQQAAAAYRNGNEKKFFKLYQLDVAPQTDQRPFPARFMKWSKFRSIYKMTGSRFYSLMLSGECVIWVVFIEALLISAVLLIIPAVASVKIGERPAVRPMVYFLSIGAGFMFIELYFIDIFTLLFADPIVSFSIVVSALLIFSGIGGYFSRYIGPGGLNKTMTVLIVLLVLTPLCLDSVMDLLLQSPKMVRYVAAPLIMSPTGILMGFPFAVGMQYLLTGPMQRVYAWAANGCASVSASIFSAHIALSSGIPTILYLAAAAYAIAYACRGKGKQKPSREDE